MERDKADGYKFVLVGLEATVFGQNVLYECGHCFGVFGLMGDRTDCLVFSYYVHVRASFLLEFLY